MCKFIHDGTNSVLNISEMKEQHTLRATRCTTCWGSLSRITLKEAVKRHSSISFSQPCLIKKNLFSFSCYKIQKSTNILNVSFLLTLHQQFHPRLEKGPPYSPIKPSSPRFFWSVIKQVSFIQKCLFHII